MPTAPFWVDDKERCKKEYPNGCRDGIHPDGALMTYFNPQGAVQGVVPQIQNTCYKWGTAPTLSDELSCDIRNHASVCTKAMVKHVHRMGTSSAMFLLKRSRCDKITNRCFTYKVHS